MSIIARRRSLAVSIHTGNFHLRNLSMHRATSEEEALNLLFLGDTNRAISETAMNQASSEVIVCSPYSWNVEARAAPTRCEVEITS